MNITGTPPVEVLRQVSGRHVRIAPIDPFKAMIVEPVDDPGCTLGGGGYTWVEVVPTANGEWTQLPHGRSGISNRYPAYEINDNRNVPIGTVVTMYQGEFNQDCRGQEFLFDYCCSAGYPAYYGSGSGPKLTPCQCIYRIFQTRPSTLYLSLIDLSGAGSCEVTVPLTLIHALPDCSVIGKEVIGVWKTTTAVVGSCSPVTFSLFLDDPNIPGSGAAPQDCFGRLYTAHGFFSSCINLVIISCDPLVMTGNYGTAPPFGLPCGCSAFNPLGVVITE